jgi:uncharacterized membrane protein HdeD (DUF308 family)
VGYFHHLLAAIMFGIAGLLLVTRPTKSAEVATVFMAMLFLVGGLFQISDRAQSRTCSQASSKQRRGLKSCNLHSNQIKSAA